MEHCGWHEVCQACFLLFRSSRARLSRERDIVHGRTVGRARGRSTAEAGGASLVVEPRPPWERWRSQGLLSQSSRLWVLPRFAGEDAAQSKGRRRPTPNLKLPGHRPAQQPAERAGSLRQVASELRHFAPEPREATSTLRHSASQQPDNLTKRGDSASDSRHSAAESRYLAGHNLILRLSRVMLRLLLVTC